MTVLSINAGRSEPIVIAGSERPTGIWKRPIEGPVHIGTGGVASDFIADEVHHGGPDQAVYIYSKEDYDWWSAKEQREFEPGAFGENLLVSTIGERVLRVGDRSLRS